MEIQTIRGMPKTCSGIFFDETYFRLRGAEMWVLLSEVSD